MEAPRGAMAALCAGRNPAGSGNQWVNGRKLHCKRNTEKIIESFSRDTGTNYGTGLVPFDHCREHTHLRELKPLWKARPQATWTLPLEQRLAASRPSPDKELKKDDSRRLQQVFRWFYIIEWANSLGSRLLTRFYQWKWPGCIKIYGFFEVEN